MDPDVSSVIFKSLVMLDVQLDQENKDSRIILYNPE